MQKSMFDYFCEHFEQANIIGTYDLIKTEDDRVFAIEQNSDVVIEFTTSYKRLLQSKSICLCQGMGGSWVAINRKSD